MNDLGKKVKTSIERIQNFSELFNIKDDGLFLAFSGGKDSVVCKALLDMAGVKYDAHYRVTSVDPPELVQFVKEKHPDVSRDVPRYTKWNEGAYRGEEWIGKPITMWNLIPWKTILPTRISRYCCKYLKESSGDGRLTVTGVRWAESVNRKNKQGIVTVQGKKANKELSENENFVPTGNRGAVLVNDNAESRMVIDACVTRHKTLLNPIIDWTDKDVWTFIRSEKIPYCELYDDGFRRLGCIGCPMATTKERHKEFAYWPKYRENYLKSIEKMLKVRKENGKLEGNMRWGRTPEEMMHWWLEDGVLPGQETMEVFK